MNEILPGIFEVLPSKPTQKKYRTFFIKRDQGNLLVPCFANKSTIETHFATIRQAGGLTKQLLGDSHFKSAHCDEVAQHFNAPLYCSEVELAAMDAELKEVAAFPFERHFLEPDLEVLPTPGHRVGGVCYLLTMRGKRYLFVGDFIWHDGEKWIPTPTKTGVATYRQSLQLLAQLEFDVLLVNSIISNPTCFITVDDSRKAALIATLQQQLAS